MSRRVSLLCVFLSGLAAGALCRSDRPSPVGAPGAELRGGITVRRPGQPWERLRPHCVRTDGVPVYVDHDMPGDRPVTVVTLGDGRVVIGATADE